MRDEMAKRRLLHQQRGMSALFQPNSRHAKLRTGRAETSRTGDRRPQRRPLPGRTRRPKRHQRRQRQRQRGRRGPCRADLSGRQQLQMTRTRTIEPRAMASLVICRCPVPECSRTRLHRLVRVHGIALDHGRTATFPATQHGGPGTFGIFSARGAPTRVPKKGRAKEGTWVG